MLGKLIKHEWKATWKLVLLLNAALLLMTLLGIVAILTRVWESPYLVLRMLTASAAIVYYISLIAIVLGVTIFIYFRFYKSMYTDEGYLSHTLPVNSRQLIWSRLLLHAGYTLFTYFNVAFNVFLVFITLSEGLHLNDSNNIFLWDMFERETGMSFSIFLLLGLIFILIACVSGVLTGYASVSFGQLFGQHKVLGSIASYFGIQTVGQIAGMFIMIPIMLSNMNAMTNPSDFVPFFRLLTTATLVFSLVLCVALYFATDIIMRKKLNLD